MQVENLLLSNEGNIRLCDFGSATTVSHYPDHTWSALQRSTVEDEASHLDSPFSLSGEICLSLQYEFFSLLADSCLGLKSWL